MMTLNGISASGGIAVGRAFIYRRHATDMNVSAGSRESESENFKNACNKATKQLDSLIEKLNQSGETENAGIINIQKFLLNDIEFVGAVLNYIENEDYSASSAVRTVGEELKEFFAAKDDDYMRARSADFADISGRLMRILHGQTQNSLNSMASPCIIVADDLLPSETITMDRSKILGIATKGGSTMSHTAILARSLGIPAVVGLGQSIDEISDGTILIVDGEEGTVEINPDSAQVAKYKRNAIAFSDRERERSLSASQAAQTLDGVKIEVCANIGGPSDITKSLLEQADGIGLLRSEFLYLGRENYPDEQTQFESYQAVLEMFNPRRVVIRTIDIGADKKIAYFNLPEEENPALGYRAVRICIDRPEVFKTQLRALMRASAYGRLAIMIPMITSAEEIDKVQQLIEEAKQELLVRNGFVPDHFEMGIMVETPAAAIMSAELAKKVDFFSIGSNDLTQYTLAADRMNVGTGSVYNQQDESVLRLIDLTAQNAKKSGIWCGICGEIAANTDLTERFLKNGVTELSMSLSFIPGIKDKIRTLRICDNQLP